MEFTKEQKLYAEIVQKAWDDVEFKKELMANPIATIEKLSGEKLNLPEGKTIAVKDQTDDSIVFINIPAKPKMDDVELNEEQLEAISGGVIGIGPGGCIPDPFPEPYYPFPKDVFLL